MMSARNFGIYRSQLPLLPTILVLSSLVAGALGGEASTGPTVERPNFVVVFTSDNGPQIWEGEGGMDLDA